MDIVAWLAFIVFFAIVFVWGWKEGISHYKKQRPKTAIDKVGDVVLDFDWGWTRATIITGDNMWKIKKTTRDGMSVVVVKNDHETILTMDEAHQLGRALSMVAWRKVDEV